MFRHPSLKVVSSGQNTELNTRTQTRRQILPSNPVQKGKTPNRVYPKQLEPLKERIKVEKLSIQVLRMTNPTGNHTTLVVRQTTDG